MPFLNKNFIAGYEHVGNLVVLCEKSWCNSKVLVYRCYKQKVEAMSAATVLLVFQVILTSWHIKNSLLDKWLNATAGHA